MRSALFDVAMAVINIVKQTSLTADHAHRHHPPALYSLALVVGGDSGDGGGGSCGRIDNGVCDDSQTAAVSFFLKLGKWGHHCRATPNPQAPKTPPVPSLSVFAVKRGPCQGVRVRDGGGCPPPTHLNSSTNSLTQPYCRTPAMSLFI